ncbi:MAG: phosphoribosylaminoimidazolesuccinocarboxamide synthase [Saprospiraceae bacterium]|nr:phosphoribosylaminoimidazolesuccinocarboxamide synthase [Saprospiraceae bacterium]
MSALFQTDLQFPGQSNFYRGKVRDVYTIGDLLVMIASDRISAFDHVLPKPIPHKGQVLNQTAVHFLQATKDIVPNWLLNSPDPNVSIGVQCEPFKIEMVIRGYLAGHAWREYRSGKRKLCGMSMPNDMREGDHFPTPIITPATKAEEGHDEDITVDEILERGLATQKQWDQLEHYTKELFERGTRMAAERGLLLVDTKYEFGLRDGLIHLIDEIHTPDSSRYYYADGYDERQSKGEKQQQLSKEFVREWLMANGFQGKEGQEMPDMPEEFIRKVSARYIELYETMTGHTFEKVIEGEDITERIRSNVYSYFGW